MKEIAHILSDYAPQLCSLLATRQCEIFPLSRIFVLEQGKWASPADTYAKNDSWISRLPSKAYGGRLKRSLVIRTNLFGKATKNLAWSLIPSLSTCSLYQLIKGPRNILLHGLLFSLVDLLILKCFGKHIVYIHWGKPLVLSMRGRSLDALRYRLLNKIFVLMEPEIVSFQAVSGEGKVSAIVYPGRGKQEYPLVSFGNDDAPVMPQIVLGNNGFCIKEYRAMLEKTEPLPGMKIVCMLNNGLERETHIRDEFIEAGKMRFPGAFVPWVEVVPFDEYVRVQATCSYYCCPCEHQSGLGAIYTAIRMGKSILLRGDNFNHMRAMGCKVFNLDDFDRITEETWRYCRLDKKEQLHNIEAFNA